VSILARLLILLVASAAPSFAAESAHANAHALESASGANFASLDEEHTYFVGESGAWVHNTCGPALFDNGALVEALENGNESALSALKRYEPFITRSQYNEFIKGGVNNTSDRLGPDHEQVDHFGA
jgi:hypothetical protein